MRNKTQAVVEVLDLLKRLSGASDAEIGNALGLTRSGVNAKLARARKGAGSLTVDDLEDYARIFDVPTHVLLMTAEEAFKWLADNNPKVRLVVDLRDPNTVPDRPEHGSAWNPEWVERPTHPHRLIDLLVPDLSTTGQLVLTPSR